MEELDDSEHFTVAQPGDHLCTRFQCLNCQSQNIKGCNLEKDNVRDEEFTALIGHATLDAFWVFASATVKAHLFEVKFIARYGEPLKLAPLPPLTLIPLYQHGGMLQVILLLKRSLEPGCKNAMVYVSMARKTRAPLTVLWDLSFLSGSAITFSSANHIGRLVTTLSTSESHWYKTFSRGLVT